MYFEIYNKGKLIKRGKTALETLSWDNELMYTPTLDLLLPIEYLEYFDGREEVKVYVNGKVFWGIVWDLEPNKTDETISVSLRHVVSEWEYRQISVNHAMSNKELNIVYKGEKITKSEAHDEAITANDFKIMAKHVGKLTTAQYVDKAGAVAWVISNGDKVAVTTVDASKVKKDEGTYKVKFSTAKGTSVEVDCEVVSQLKYEDQQTNTANGETIAATPFKVATEEGMTADIVKEKVKAKAWVKGHKSQTVEVTSITTDFQNLEGEYDVTASTAAGTSITVKVEVVNTGSYENVGDPSVVDKLEDIYNDKNFAYPGWQIDFQDDAENQMIDYVYSRQNKLEALTQTMELTADYFWRVGFNNEKKIEIGKFGEKKPYIVSLKPSGESNIRIITEPVIDYDFENVINVATVYSDKSDSGMSSLTLREVYERPSLQRDGFPVVILHSNVNNERDYTRYISQYPKLAPNNELEFAVLDEHSIALESGTVIEGTYAYNDMSPFETDEEGKTKSIDDAKRIQAAKTVYERTIRKLIQARRSYNLTVTVEEIPPDLYVGDRVRFLYDNRIWNMDACSNWWKKILSLDDWFYVTHISYEIDEYGVETNELTLTKWIRIDRETTND